MKQVLFLTLFISALSSTAQNFTLTQLKNNQWISSLVITDFNISSYKKIGLGKLNTPIDSIKINASVWEFDEKTITIRNYTLNKGLDSISVKCTYTFDPKKNTIQIFHFTQDSSFWEYNLGIISSGSYVVMTRLKE